MPQHNLFRSLCCLAINSQHLIDDTEQSIKRWLDCIAVVDGDVPVQDLL